MSIDLKTLNVEPLRKSFDHIAARIGPDKTPTRYQEGVWGLQPDLNFHYRPTWDPAHALYDRTRTALVMRDFDDLVDPRQHYYGSWTIQRGRQQDSQEKNFEFVEKRDLASQLDAAWRDRLVRFVVPCRHLAWAANINNSSIAAYGFGAPLTSACAMHMMDQLGVAQYLSRIGLVLGDNTPEVLDAAKDAWMNAPMWQPMRQLTEDTMVLGDWGELFVVQNLLVDGAVHPLVFERFDRALIAHGGAFLALLAEFMVDWYAESSRWVDAMVKGFAAESADNAALIARWCAHWLPRVAAALAPLAAFAFEREGGAELDQIVQALEARVARLGVKVGG